MIDNENPTVDPDMANKNIFATSNFWKDSVLALFSDLAHTQ